jgi:thioester reductase-like protein
MKDINQVQKALESKAKKELQQVVDEFVISLNRLNDKYREPNTYCMKESRSVDAAQFSFIRPGAVETILKDMLVEAYLEPMVHKNTQELLTKLELL